MHRVYRGLPRFVVFVGWKKGKEMEGEVGNLEWPALAPLGSALPPKVGVWCRRDVTFPKIIAFGVDETTLDFSNVHLV